MNCLHVVSLAHSEEQARLRKFFLYLIRNGNKGQPHIIGEFPSRRGCLNEQITNSQSRGLC